MVCIFSWTGCMEEFQVCLCEEKIGKQQKLEGAAID